MLHGPLTAGLLISSAGRGAAGHLNIVPGGCYCFKAAKFGESCTVLHCSSVAVLEVNANISFTIQLLLGQAFPKYPTYWQLTKMQVLLRSQLEKWCIHVVPTCRGMVCDCAVQWPSLAARPVGFRPTQMASAPTTPDATAVPGVLVSQAHGQHVCGSRQLSFANITF